MKRLTFLAAAAATIAAPAIAQNRTTKITYWCWSEHARSPTSSTRALCRRWPCGRGRYSRNAVSAVTAVTGRPGVWT